jgi:hypothetical protein
VWMSRDPVGLSASLSLTDYAGSNPTNLTDPYGLKEKWPTLKNANGMKQEEWLKALIGNLQIEVDQKLKDAFKNTLNRGCIGAAATLAGYSDPVKFLDELTDCYWNLKDAEKAQANKKCKGEKSAYGTKPSATMVAIQWLLAHWDNNNPKGVTWEKKDYGKEPFTLGREPNYTAVNQGFLDGKQYTGSFDVQIKSPRLEYWLGADQGGPNMKILVFTDDQLKAHIKKSDPPYSMQAYCVVCEKSY